MDDMPFETDAAESVPDNSAKAYDQIVAFVEERFSRAEDKRRADEDRMLTAYRNFKGDYGPDTQFTEAEKSRVFVKVTKTKVLGAYGQIIDVLFGSDKFPITVDNTAVPEGVSESVSLDPQAPPQAPKAPPVAPFGTRDGPPLPPGTTIFDTMKLGPLTEKLAPVKDKLVAGPGTTATAVTFHPAEVAAKKMEKKIHDQLDEGNASKHLRSFVFEMGLFGTGVFKGPFAVDKEYPNWDAQGNYVPTIKTTPMCAQVSVWNFYPDPDGVNMDDVEWVVERHKLSRTSLNNLKQRPFFRKTAINKAVAAGPNYIRKYWEDIMDDGNVTPNIERYEALEYWGYVPIDMLRDYGVSIPKQYAKFDTVNVNIWICNSQVIRLVMNPFKPTRIPYYACPYELNPYSFFGVGVAENMEDTQILMNGFMRMAVDNAALSGNLLIEVDEENLAPGQDFNMYPGKIIKRRGGPPGQAVFGTQFPNVSQQNMMMFDKARVLADESTGLPSYAQGQTGVTGIGRTAAGISMLMDAANGSIRSVVKNVDDYLLAPLGKAYFAFNMQFDHDPDIKGDLEVNARGTESLMAGEIMSQRLMQFLQLVSNPMLAPFAKIDVIIRQIAKSLDIDPDLVVNSLPDATLQAEVLKGMMVQAPTQQGGPQQPPEAPMGGMSVESGPGSGGQTSGVGNAPTPGSPGFSANNQTGPR